MGTNETRDGYWCTDPHSNIRGYTHAPNHWHPGAHRQPFTAPTNNPTVTVAELEARIEAAKDILTTHFNQPRFVGTTTLDTVTHAIWELNGRPEHE